MEEPLTMPLSVSVFRIRNPQKWIALVFLLVSLSRRPKKGGTLPTIWVLVWTMFLLQGPGPCVNVDSCQFVLGVPCFFPSKTRKKQRSHMGVEHGWLPWGNPPLTGLEYPPEGGPIVRPKASSVPCRNPLFPNVPFKANARFHVN